MITPTKGISPQRALLSVAAQIVESLNEPMTVSQLWQALLAWRADKGASEALSFTWYSYSLDVLFAMGLIDFNDGLIYKIEG